MAYPLIILGAGASFDFLKISRHSTDDQLVLKQWQAPLTNNIFDVSRFSRIIGKYEDVKPLASTITNIVDNTSPFDLEAYLTEQESRYSDKSAPQIVALRFYLAELMGKVSHYFFNHVNNHRDLIDQIDKKVGKALVINFNYDTLFESNLHNVCGTTSLENYISGDIKVIKIHGAHNWRYAPNMETQKYGVYDYFHDRSTKIGDEYKNREIFQFTVKNVGYPDREFDLNLYRENKPNGFTGGQWLYYLPALAIPIASKGDYVCPDNHIKVMRDELEQVDRILVLGWRAQDSFILNELKGHLPNNVRLTIVSSDEASGRTVSHKFEDIAQIGIDNIQVSPHNGYTEFMINRGYERFLSH